MSQTTVEYVEKIAGGGWRLTGRRVSFDSVIHGYGDGRSPEGIVEEFPRLSVEHVYGAIACYLRHRADIDRYLDEQSDRWRQLQLASEAQHGPLLDRIRSSRARPKACT